MNTNKEMNFSIFERSTGRKQFFLSYLLKAVDRLEKDYVIYNKAIDMGENDILREYQKLYHDDVMIVVEAFNNFKNGGAK